MAVLGAQEQAHIRHGLQQRLLVMEDSIAVAAEVVLTNLPVSKVLVAQVVVDKAALTMTSLLLAMQIQVVAEVLVEVALEHIQRQQGVQAL
jgi:hypothetical protein